MARTLPTAVQVLNLTVLSAALLVGCTPSPDPQLIDAATTSAQPAPGLSPDARPEIPTGRDGWVECPYLDADWVAETNGQVVTGVGIDERFPTPACVFWSYPEEPQLSVIVREMPDEAAAIAVVDWAAPVDTTEPAEEIPGWSGGRAGAGIGGHDSARYAVQKGTWAVVVDSNQEQSLKAELTAREVIANLGL